MIAIDAEYKRVERLKSRVGRPRIFWLQTTMARAHKLRRSFAKEMQVDFNIPNKQQREYVANAALSREYPFDKDKKDEKTSNKGKSRKNKGTNARQKRNKTRPRTKNTKAPEQNNWHEQWSSGGRVHGGGNGRLENEPT
jgi:hypothetical protein